MDSVWLMVLLGVLGIGGALFCWVMLGVDDFDDDDAARYAELQREMDLYKE